MARHQGGRRRPRQFAAKRSVVKGLRDWRERVEGLASDPQWDRVHGHFGPASQETTMTRITRLFLLLTVIGPLHMAEQMLTSIE